MKNFIKDDSLLLYLLFSCIFIEIIFRMTTVAGIFTFDLVIALLFLSSVSVMVYILCSFFSETVNYILSIVLIGAISFIYTSQFIYYKFFRTFYSIYSMGNGGQIIEFWKDVFTLLIRNSGWILLFFLPAILLIIFGKKRLTFKKVNGYNRVSLLICIVLLHVTALGAVYSIGKEKNSAYDLYFKNAYPLLSVKRLGLITTMRLDLQRQVSGWSPTLERPEAKKPEVLPVVLPIQDDRDKEPTKEQEEKIVQYNSMQVDFHKLMADEKDPSVKELHEYFYYSKPTAKNEYTGKFEGYNLIFITAEGLAPYAIQKDITPTLYKMVQEGYNFTNFYTPLWEVSTSDGEYVACTGLLPKSGIWSFRESGRNYLPFVMGNQLKQLNYKTVAYHNHTYTYYGRNTSHPNMGYEYKGIGNGLNVKETWPESDLEMMELSIPEFIENDKFHAYYMTVSGHMQYSFSGNYIAWKNKKHVENLPYSTQGQAYFATQIELDKALEHLLTQLEARGIAEKTLIVISADHYPYGLEDKTIDELAGHPVEKHFELYKNAFIVYAKGMEPETIIKPASSLDIIPTLSNLLGLEYDSRMLMGKDIFSDSEPLVIFKDRSFITNKGRYNAETNEFIANKGEEVDEAYINNISSLVQEKFYFSAKILETDYYNKVFKRK